MTATRALFVCPNMNTGGAERQWAVLLPLLRSRGISVQLATLDDEGPLFGEVRRSGVEAVCAGLRRRLDVAGWRRIHKLAKRADVIVSRGPSAQVVGELVARARRIRHVTTDHTPLDSSGRLRPWRKDQEILIRRVAARADAVVAVTAAQIPALVRLGYRRERIHVIANGVDANDLEPRRSRAATRAELGIRPHQFAVLLAAANRPEKRIGDFLEAMRMLSDDRRIVGVVAGAGSDTDEFRRQCSGNVVALGRRDDVADLIHAADICALASDAEALPMFLLEAMALARPVVATDVGGNSELVVDGETGRLVPSGDAAALAAGIRALAEDPNLTRVGEAARARQQRSFTAERMADEYAARLQAAAA
jgi:glycosyltransferase involved in cell wall biosynthesis